MRAFWLALQFLTRLPVPVQPPPGPDELGRSVVHYPLVGLLLGALLAGSSALLPDRDPILVAALLLAVWALLTGGLHLDGLADSIDAWVGSHGDRERALAIMKDPRSGPAAVAGVTVVLLLKFAALSVLLRTEAWPALVIAPLLGRSALVLILLSTPYVRPQGLGAGQAAGLPAAPARLVLIGVAGLVAWGGGLPGAAALAAAVVVVYLLRRMMLARLGGTTGDTLGASCELVETAVLVVMALIAG
ncbi:cobalamin synthase [Sulfurifustis variabilis]|uniref:Adenosylcobinamide-GDP ribazoletransferase n=1 Tax=Sulfurifustis variabilis TaxID=1675686 RepID=A0A1B4VBA4_9GAMM|nr:adenosylcobinamide-GDP ribazoletransferase [Sulfurifustis variabilis]BAU47721.1 cobalamin synthase [Sulfurifustis variabilis]